MNKHFFLAIAFLLIIPLFASAQSTDKKINQIRKQYQAAQSVAKFVNTDDWLEHNCHTLTLKSMINYAGGGMMEHSTEVLLTRATDNNENPDAFNTFKPWLTKETLGGSVVVYRELLFDKTTTQLIFCYQRMTLPDDNVDEVRFYYDKGKLIKTVPANERNVYLSTPDMIKSIAEAIKNMVSNYNSVDAR